MLRTSRLVGRDLLIARMPLLCLANPLESVDFSLIFHLRFLYLSDQAVNRSFSECGETSHKLYEPTIFRQGAGEEYGWRGIDARGLDPFFVLSRNSGPIVSRKRYFRKAGKDGLIDEPKPRRTLIAGKL